MHLSGRTSVQSAPDQRQVTQTRHSRIPWCWRQAQPPLGLTRDVDLEGLTAAAAGQPLLSSALRAGHGRSGGAEHSPPAQQLGEWVGTRGQTAFPDSVPGDEHLGTSPRAFAATDQGLGRNRWADAKMYSEMQRTYNGLSKRL